MTVTSGLKPQQELNRFIKTRLFGVFTCSIEVQGVGGAGELRCAASAYVSLRFIPRIAVGGRSLSHLTVSLWETCGLL